MQEWIEGRAVVAPGQGKEGRDCVGPPWGGDVERHSIYIRVTPFMVWTQPRTYWTMCCLSRAFEAS